MDPSTLIQHATPSMTIFLVLTFLSVIAGLSIGALLISRRALNPSVSGLCTGILALGAALLCVWGASSDDPYTAVAAGTGVLLVAPFFALLPASLHAAMALGGALREAPRRWLWPALGAVLAVCVVAAPMIGGWVSGNGFFELSLLRVVPYGIVLMLTVPALAAGGEGPAGAASSASAGLSMLCFVGLGEASVRGAFAFLMQGRFGSLPDAAAREAFVVNARADLLDPVLSWSWLAFGAAAALAIVAHVPLIRREGGGLAALGLIWIPLAALPLLFADVPVAAWAALAGALP